MKPLKINRTNDALFKYIFANEQYKLITLDFINSVFEFRGLAGITDLEFLDRELSAEGEKQKSSRLDFLARCSDGSKINIEIQVVQIKGMDKRTLFYWCRVYNDLKEGEDYNDLCRTVSIIILDFEISDKKQYPAFHSVFGLYDNLTGNKFSDDLEIHVIELPKWKLQIMGDDQKPDREKIKELRRLEKWVSYFSKRTKGEELEAIAMSEPRIKEALAAQTIFRRDKDSWGEYQDAEKQKSDEKAIRRTALEEGEARGLKKGEKIGEKRGEKRGEKIGEMNMLHLLYKNGAISLDVAASNAGKTVSQLRKLWKLDS